MVRSHESVDFINRSYYADGLVLQSQSKMPKDKLWSNSHILDDNFPVLFRLLLSQISLVSLSYLYLSFYRERKKQTENKFASLPFITSSLFVLLT
jgi:hypothetical protein